MQEHVNDSLRDFIHFASLLAILGLGMIDD